VPRLLAASPASARTVIVVADLMTNGILDRAFADLAWCANSRIP